MMVAGFSALDGTLHERNRRPHLYTMVSNCGAARREAVQDEFCGAVPPPAWPMPADVVEAYEVFAAKLRQLCRPAHMCIQPPRCIACAYDPRIPAGPLGGLGRLAKAWTAVSRPHKVLAGTGKFKLKKDGRRSRARLVSSATKIAMARWPRCAIAFRAIRDQRRP